MPIIRTAHPTLYRIAVGRHRFMRRLSWLAKRVRFAKTRTETNLPFVVFRHKSVLLRKLGDADMRLQHNKVTNLKRAAKEIHRVCIKPGETFSFWKLVGNPTEERGFVEGMLLSNGEIVTGIGGGLCQLANLLYWMVLHSPLTVVERYRHSFDPFPDSGRVLPFGSGATIFYNYIDLQFRNDTESTFEILVWVDETFLHGELRADREQPHTYHVVERNHRFLRERTSGQHYRSNEIYRQTRNRQTGTILAEELVCKNHSLMKYEPPAGSQVEVLDER